MEELKTWKVILGIVLAIVTMIVSQTLAEIIASLLVLVRVPLFIGNILCGILYIAFAFIILKLIVEKFLKSELRDFAIPKFQLKLKWITAAIALPISVTIVYLLFPGKIEKNDMTGIKMLETICVGLFFTGLAAGIVEELVFRGLIMNLLLKKWGKKIAIIIPSFLFGVVHIIGMDFTLLSCLQVIIAGTVVGIMFSLIALDNNSIWNSAIVHAIWNFVIIGGVLSVSETVNESSIFSYVLNTKQFAITGGEFGIESSIIAIVGYVIVGAIAFLGIKKKTKDGVEK